MRVHVEMSEGYVRVTPCARVTISKNLGGDESDEGNMTARREPDEQNDQFYRHARGVLGKAIDKFQGGVGLAADHPYHALKALYDEVAEHIGRLAERKDAEAEKEAEADALAALPDSGARHVSRTSKQLRQTHETLLEKRAELIAATEGISIQKARVLAMDRDPITTEVLMHTSDPSVQESASQQEAWTELKEFADTLIQKAGKVVSPEKALDQAMILRPDLVRKYFGWPELDRVRR
jgi:hypothetical protein